MYQNVIMQEYKTTRKTYIIMLEKILTENKCLFMNFEKRISEIVT